MTPADPFHLIDTWVAAQPDGRVLRSTHIHASDTFITDWLEAPRASS